MKKILLGLSMLFLFSLGVEASISSIRMNTISEDSVAAGETTKIIIKATKGINIELTGVEGFFEYNQNDFTLVSVKSLRNNWRVLQGEIIDDGLTIIANDTGRADSIETSGEIFEVVLRAKATSVIRESTIRFNQVSCWVLDEGDPEPCNSSTTTINILPGQSSINTLRSLSIIGYPISPIFNGSITNYSSTVPNYIDRVTISAQPTHSEANYVVVGNTELEYGQNEVSVIVTAENGAEKTYTIMVTRLESSDMNGLSSLVINNGWIDPEFNNAIFSYFVNVLDTVTELDISAIPVKEEATVEIKNNNFTAEDEPIIEIVVSSGNDQVITYYLEVNFIESSDNAKLAKLEIEGFDIDFDPEQKQYTISTKKDLNDLVLVIETEDEYATYEVNIADNRIEIVVTSSSGETETYEIINEKSDSLLLYIIIAVGSILVITGTVLGIRKLKMKKNMIKEDKIKD